VECRPDVELWCDGKLVPPPNRGIVDSDDPNEVTMSWRKVIVDGRSEYHVMVGGIDPLERIFEEPQSKQEVKGLFGPVSIEKPIKLTKAGDSVVVWAMGAGSVVGVGNAEDVEKMLKTAPWVLVLRIEVVKKR
jgi:hypothetical protein